jgi:beta-lactamase superfamily II metal-dependent hydrolase
MGTDLEAYLVKSNTDLKADLYKAPHHGADLLLNEFYSRVGASAVLVPSPTMLWNSVRCISLRNYLIEHHIATYVSGICGNVTATLTAQGYSIETER